ncbi:MAG: hypothetical protein RH982_16070 [Parvibaculum sp.]
MIRFAIKSLVVLVLVGHAIKLVEPADPAVVSATAPHFVPASYSEGTAPGEIPEVATQLSSFTNAQIVVSHAARDASGFCEREPLACQSGRELLVRSARSVRDLAAGVVDWAGTEDQPGEESQPVEEYRPLEGYRGPYPPLPPLEAPARHDSF